MPPHDHLGRIYSKCVRDETGCLIWQRATNDAGYGLCTYGGKHQVVHRVVWALERGPIPDRHVVRHTCDVRPCAEIEHLYLVAPVKERGVCVVRGCDSPVSRLTLCATHYRKKFQGKELGPLGQYNRTTEAGKRCPKCGEFKPLTAYYEKSNAALRSYCRDCQLRLRRAHKYGVDEAHFDELMAQQQGRCAICGTDQCNSGRRLSIDHDHETGKTRGLLCSACNFGVGNFKDDVQLLSAAIEYLNRWA